MEGIFPVSTAEEMIRDSGIWTLPIPILTTPQAVVQFCDSLVNVVERAGKADSEVVRLIQHIPVEEVDEARLLARKVG